MTGSRNIFFKLPICFLAFLALVQLGPGEAQARCETGKSSRCIIVQNASKLSGPPNPFFEEGLRLLEKQDDKRAEIFFRKALQVFPDDARPHLASAMLFEKEGKAIEALNAYSAALAIDASNPLALARRAEIHAILGNVEKALIDLSKLLEIEPDRQSARNMRAEIYLQQKRFAEAANDYLAIADSNDLDPRWRLASARAFELAGDDKAALAQLDALLHNFPDEADALLLHGRMLLENGDKQAARADLEKLLAREHANNELEAEAEKLLKEAIK